MQEPIVKAEVLERFFRYHLLAAIKIYLSKELKRGSELWKFNNSLLQGEIFVKWLDKYIIEFKTQDTGKVLDEQIKQDFLKYEIRKSCLVFSNSLQKEKNPQLRK